MPGKCDQCKETVAKMTHYDGKGWLCEKCKVEHIKEPVAPLIKFKGKDWPSKFLKLKHKYFGY